MRIFLSAGEPSGDVHGANLIHALRRLDPSVECVGFGGERMEAAGCRLLYPLCRLAVMWFLRVLLNAPRFLRRLRGDDPTRPIGDALLDQTTIAGIGNVWKSEGCFAAELDPWRPVGAVSDEEALPVVAATRPRLPGAPRPAGHCPRPRSASSARRWPRRSPTG